MSITGKLDPRITNFSCKRVREDTMTLKEPCREFGIPPRTLKRRITNNNTLKGRIQPTSVLGVEAEKKIVAHVIKLQKQPNSYRFKTNLTKRNV
jgi:hypothetical protein